MQHLETILFLGSCIPEHDRVEFLYGVESCLVSSDYFEVHTVYSHKCARVQIFLFAK